MSTKIRPRIGIPALAAVVFTALALLPGAASAQSPLVFGIQPAGGSTTANRGSYFTYELTPGAAVDDILVVSNDGAEQVILKLFAADGITSINGSTSFADPGDIRSNTLSWLSTTLTAVPVPPGQDVSVPFHIQVPRDATPGDHVAGWVVEAPPRAGTVGGVGANVTSRAGVAVVVRIPGETNPELVLGGICLNQETGSNYFEVSVRNQGNVLTRAAGTLTLETRGGDEVFTRPADLGNVVPADGTVMRLDAPGDPGPGEYVATVTMAQPDGRVIESRSDIKIGNKKVNGCVAGSAQGDDPGQGIPYLGRLPGGGTPWLLLILLAILLATLIAGREYMIRRRLKAAEQQQNDR